MEYFGTSLTSHGHYTWDLSGDSMVKKRLMPNTPFNPYELNKSQKKGSVVFCTDNNNGLTIIAIEGSCIDNRGGTKSVFWVYEILSKEEMIEILMSNKHSKKIIEAMPFDVVF